MGVLAFDAEAIVSGILDTARLGSGAADNTKYLRGDQSWQVIDLTPYVPYTGATTNLNMGMYGVTVGASADIRWSGRSIMQSPSDGLVRLYNSASSQGFCIDFSTSTVKFRNSLDSADAPITCAALTASGNGTVANPALAITSTYGFSSNQGLNLSNGGADWVQLSNSSTGHTRLRSDGMLAWISNTTLAGGTTDVALARNAAGVLEINNGSAGTYRDLYARAATFSGKVESSATFIPGSFTVATLPSTSAAGRVTGARATVTDSNATITAGIGAVVAGGGTDVVCVMWDGTNWRIA